MKTALTKYMCMLALSDAAAQPDRWLFSTAIFPSDDNSNNLQIAETSLNTAALLSAAAATNSCRQQRKLDL